MASSVSMSRLVVAVSIVITTAALPRLSSAQRPTARYPTMAPIEQYRMTASAEIALAKSAAPAAISGDADIFVLGDKGYERVVKGRNGFACIVERSWANNFTHSEFWNPKTRGPICFNAAAARSVLPPYLTRTEWVLAGRSQSEMQERSRPTLSASQDLAGAMCYMLSKTGYLGDDAGGPWHPHLMFFQPRGSSAEWGANLPHSPVFLVDSGGSEPFVVLAIPVPRWSDGTRDSTTVHEGTLREPRDGRTSRVDWTPKTEASRRPAQPRPPASGTTSRRR